MKKFDHRVLYLRTVIIIHAFDIGSGIVLIHLNDFYSYRKPIKGQVKREQIFFACFII